MRPNGGKDEFPGNDEMHASFIIPPTYENQLVFKFKSIHMANSLSWILTDQDGNLVYQNGPLDYNTVYTDTFNLSKGCYRLILRNAEGEGLNYWANMPPYGNGTAGYAQLKTMSGQMIKSFQGDFGREIAQSFTVGMTIDVPELYPGGYINIYPNPTSGRFEISLIHDHPQEVTVRVHDALGNRVDHGVFSVSGQSILPMDITSSPAGIYFVTVITETGTTIRKIVKY
ncbi:MAG: T9SS type A sorting domain-containing protein [Bacteroidales bacterium]|nr:T9SS type A sorting domain-containing protein [Bacteroidales bacterium]